ncbi:MAG: macro domain-containing protein [Oscillospiraceae bacterium]|nr:macro domain-containing protein [Oscillospiraceae bacterium]
MPFEIVRNDMTKMRVDAIVNPTNRDLVPGGGLDAAVHKAAGPELVKACRAIGSCGTGDAIITRGFDLPARYVIHTVGPVWHGGQRGEKALLTSCYQRCLELARAHDCGSIAFPLISAGTFGYPKDEAMAVALDMISRFLFENDMLIYLVVFGRAEYLTSKKLFSDVQAYIDDVYAASHYHRNAESRRREQWQADEAAAQGYEAELFDSAFPTEASSVGSLLPDWSKVFEEADEGFSEALLRLIDEKGMTDVQCYNKANIDKRLFSKIRSNPAYKPSKPTAFALAIALELSLEETSALLRKAGFAISHSSKLDIIVEYFIRNKQYNIFEINEVLFDFDQPLLGNCAK